MRRVKGAVPNAPKPKKRYVQNENYYSFGPLLKFKEADWRLPPSEELEGDALDLAMKNHNLVSQTNLDVIRFSNTGHYKCTVNLNFEDTSEEVAGVFLVEPAVFMLEEGETKEVGISAFPKEEKEFRNRLVACVSENPHPITMDLCCSGVEPLMEFDGPWAETIAAAQAELDANEDPKAAKALEDALDEAKGKMSLDFDRMLVGKSEFRSFVIRNTSELPVKWMIDMGDFAESANIDILPKS
jgi:hypothetical protein